MLKRHRQIAIPLANLIFFISQEMCYSSKENNFKETKHSAFIKKNEIKWEWGESRDISGYSESFYSFPVKHY